MDYLLLLCLWFSMQNSTITSPWDFFCPSKYQRPLSVSKQWLVTCSTGTLTDPLWILSLMPPPPRRAYTVLVVPNLHFSDHFLQDLLLPWCWSRSVLTWHAIKMLNRTSFSRFSGKGHKYYTGSYAIAPYLHHIFLVACSLRFCRILEDNSLVWEGRCKGSLVHVIVCSFL